MVEISLVIKIPLFICSLEDFFKVEKYKNLRPQNQ